MSLKKRYISYNFNIFDEIKPIYFTIMTHFRRSFQCVNCENCNEKISLLSVLKQEEMTIVNDKRFEVRFKAGENIIKQGTASANLAFLTTGLAKEYIEGYDNRDLILEIVQPWHLFGGPGIYVDMRYHYSVAALEDSTACFIDTVNFKKLIRLNVDFAEEFIKYCNTCSTNTFERFLSLTQKQMHGRIADVLIYLSETIYKNLSFDLSMSRQEIADFSGMSKDSAIRILKELENEHIIDANGKKISILKMNLLKEISVKG
jgi:CRP-like cAMP-binding protein